jgi:hypothetical protein
LQSRLDPEGEKLLDNFLDAQEIFQNANERTLTSAKRNFERAKESIGDKISWQEMNILESNYSQKPHAQIEVAGPSKTGDY